MKYVQSKKRIKLIEKSINDSQLFISNCFSYNYIENIDLSIYVIKKEKKIYFMYRNKSIPLEVFLEYCDDPLKRYMINNLDMYL